MIKISLSPGEVGVAQTDGGGWIKLAGSSLSAHQVGNYAAVFQLRQQPVATCLAHQQPQGNQERGNQHHILNLLIAGDAGHARDEHIGADDAGGKKDAGGVAHAENPAANQADSLELGGGISNGNEHRDSGGNQAYAIAVEPITEKFGDGVLAEAPQLSGDQAEQQHIAPGPADDVSQSEPAFQIKQPGNPHEGRRRHPVGGNCCAVAQFADSLACHPVARSAGNFGKKTDTNIDAQQGHHDDGRHQFESLFDLKDLFSGGHEQSGVGHQKCRNQQQDG